MGYRLRALRLLAALVAVASGSAYGQANSSSSNESTATAVQAARLAYRESEVAIARGTWSERDTSVACEAELPPFEVRIHRDSAGVIRRLEWSGGSEDHAETHRYFYNPQGQLRFAFFTLGAVNGTHYEERVYFSSGGQAIRRLARLVNGPGYAHRPESGMRNPTEWRRTLCQ
jgi:hypothetical protein